MNNAGRVLWQIIKYASLVFWGLVVLFPPYVVACAALKTDVEYNQTNLLQWPAHLAWSNFALAFQQGDFGLAFFNTAFIVVLSLIGNIILGTMVAYVLGRFDFKLKKLVLFAYLIVVFIPQITTQVATFGVIKNLGLFDTRFAAILLYLGTDVVQIYIYLQFVNKIPVALDEAAMLEGASYFRIYRTIIFPLMKPAIATAVILKTIAIYNDMFTPYLYMPSENLGTVSTSLMRFTGPFSAHWNLICAAVLMIAIPTIILFLILQRYIFSGIVAGSVK
ncbi:MAG: carbohydrate ABC transporter permease [Alicyclobacillus sp.]|nr:carbohydrate ABC transporter permease [Alicyclobacillus sp.]